MLIEHAPPQKRVEAELVLSCARANVDEQRARRIKKLADKAIDWDYLLEFALRHGLMPLLYRHLITICPDTVPETTLSQLRRHFYSNAKRNLLLLAELLKLFENFEKHEIAAISFKGPLLATEAYGDVALRMFGDLDILVHKKDLEKTKTLLIYMGYQPRYSFTREQEVAHLNWGHAYSFVRADGNVHIDLHWRIAQSHHSIAIDSDGLWVRSGLASIAGKAVRILALEDLLLILCLHGAKHCWERLAWICDIAEIVSARHNIDWASVMERAERLHSRRVLLLSLFLSKDLLGVALPKELAEQVDNDVLLKSLARRIYKHTFVKRPRLLTDVTRTSLYLKMKEEIPHKLLYIRYTLRRALSPNTKDRELLPLPTFLTPLHYLYRPLRLVVTYAWLSLQQICNANSTK
jgi:hypothetical protein